MKDGRFYKNALPPCPIGSALVSARMQQRSGISVENAGRVAGLLSPAADPAAPAPPASTPTTARTYNHRLCFFDQFVCFGASRSRDARWSRFSAFWRHEPTDRGKANRSNGGARQYISEHLAATHIHVSSPFFEASVVFQSPKRKLRNGFRLLYRANFSSLLLRRHNVAVHRASRRMPVGHDVCYRVITLAPERNTLTEAWVLGPLCAQQPQPANALEGLRLASE
jgi:hypothetical protein